MTPTAPNRYVVKYARMMFYLLLYAYLSPLFLVNFICFMFWVVCFSKLADEDFDLCRIVDFGAGWVDTAQRNLKANMAYSAPVRGQYNLIMHFDNACTYQPSPAMLRAINEGADRWRRRNGAA